MGFLPKDDIITLVETGRRLPRRLTASSQRLVMGFLCAFLELLGFLEFLGFLGFLGILEFLGFLGFLGFLEFLGIFSWVL